MIRFSISKTTAARSSLNIFVHRFSATIILILNLSLFLIHNPDKSGSQVLDNTEEIQLPTELLGVGSDHITI